MRRHAPFKPIDPYICMCGGVADVINCSKFRKNPSKGFGAVRPRKTAFPIGIIHRPYNSVGTTVPHWFSVPTTSLCGINHTRPTAQSFLRLKRMDGSWKVPVRCLALPVPKAVIELKAHSSSRCHPMDRKSVKDTSGWFESSINKLVTLWNPQNNSFITEIGHEMAAIGT